MKKLFTLVSMVCLCALNANAADVTVLTDSPDALVMNETVFLIKEKGQDNFIYGSNAQNIMMGTASKASAETNVVTGYKLELDDNGNYRFRAITPAGEWYTHNWASGEGHYCFLNAQPAIGGVTFNLGIDQDFEGGSSWIINSDGSIQNVGNGGYLAGTKTTETAEMFWEFAVVTPDPVLPDQEVAILTSLKPFVENETLFSLKNTSLDMYLYGSTDQNCAIGTYDESISESNAVARWKLEYEPLGGRYIFRAITPTGEWYTHGWATGDEHYCYLNAQPSIGGVAFILGANQDFKDGHCWILTEKDGGYIIQNKGNEGYLDARWVENDNGGFYQTYLAENPVVWELVTDPATSIDAISEKTAETKAVKALVNGKLLIVKGAEKFNVAGQLLK